MIDTITIEVNTHKQLTDKDFRFKAKWNTYHQQETNSAPKHMSFVALSWPEEAEAKWSYLPEVEYWNFPDPRGKAETHRYSVYRITFSAPKLLYGNNVEEVIEEQFEEIVERLHEQLQFLALPTEITKDQIRHAGVCRLDYAKNAMIAELTPADQICSMLMRTCHVANSNYAQTQYRHGASYRENIQFRSTVLYDKLAEFSNSMKKEGPANVREQFFLAAEKAHLFQVIKLEVQIQKRKQLILELKPFGIASRDITFERVFSKDLAHDILMKYWKQVTQKLNPTADMLGEDNLLAFLRDMLTNEERTTPQGTFAAVGFTYLAHKCGLDNIKDTLYKYYSKQAWDRCQNLYRELRSDRGIYSTIQSIEKCIDSMEPLRFGTEEEDENVKNW